MNDDEFYVKRCLALAEKGRGRVHPNPMVGCVVADAAGRIIGEGYHQAYGQAHAEVNALAGLDIEQTQGATVYVSLEPCSHTGKTPPCTDALLKAGVKRVVCGMADPNPKVAGQSIAHLREQEIAVTVGVLEADCNRLNEAFCHFITTQLPFTVLKTAMTLDGRIATRNGQSQWITDAPARAWVHQLRLESDAILTTAQTVLADNSRLTVRAVPLSATLPYRIVLDRTLRLTPQAALFKPTDKGGPVWILTSNRFTSQNNKWQALQTAGARVVSFQETGTGLDLRQVLHWIGRQNVAQLMVEAGGHLAGNLMNAGLVQKLWLLYGNKIFSDPGALSGFAGVPCLLPQTATHCSIRSVAQLGQAIRVEAVPINNL